MMIHRDRTPMNNPTSKLLDYNPNSAKNTKSFITAPHDKGEPPSLIYDLHKHQTDKMQNQNAQRLFALKNDITLHD